MKLLLTNDDGYTSGGLKVLKERLEKEHEVYVIAPDSNRSAVSHHFTMFTEGKIVKEDKNYWKCSGYPADCAFTGIKSNLIENGFDAVISGINYGPNLGTDTIYSGTCAAAREAVLRGVPGIAVSLDPVDWEKASREGFKFEALADFVAKNLESLIAMCKMTVPRAYTNINACSLDKYDGVEICEKPCIRTYEDAVKLEPLSETEFKTITVTGVNTAGMDMESDLGITRQNKIAVSSIYVDPICCKVVDGIKFSL